MVLWFSRNLERQKLSVWNIFFDFLVGSANWIAFAKNATLQTRSKNAQLQQRVLWFSGSNWNINLDVFRFRKRFSNSSSNLNNQTRKQYSNNTWILNQILFSLFQCFSLYLQNDCTKSIVKSDITYLTRTFREVF